MTSQLKNIYTGNDGGFFLLGMRVVYGSFRENEDVCRFYYWVNIENKHAVFFLCV